MIRLSLAGGALALFVLLSGPAGADGFPDGYRPPEPAYRPIGRVRPVRHLHAHPPTIRRHRSFHRAYAVIPPHLLRHPSLPLYNDPPQRFPEP